jgi:hypothetical protein
MFQDPNAPGGGGGWFGGGWPFGSMGQQNGLLGGGMSPAQMGLLSGFAALAQAGAPSTTPKSFAGALGQGVQGGLQGYGMGKQFEQMGEMSALRRAQMDEITRKAKAEEDMRRFRMGLMPGSNQAAASPQPSIEKSLGGPVALTPVGLEQPPQARSLEAPEPAPSNLIPVDKLQAAWANGLDIGPLLKLNEQAMPDMAYQDAGNEIVGINKRTNQIVQRIPKGAAPGSRPFEASDQTPAQHRDFLTGKARAGAPTIDARVSQGVAGEVKEIISASHSAASGAVSSLETLSNVEKAISSGNVNLGPGATIRNKVDQVAQWMKVGGKDTDERLVNTRNVIRGLAQSTMNARKALKGQGSVSDYEGKLLKMAESGEIDDMTLPELKDFVGLSRRMAEKVVAQHKRQMKNLEKTPGGKDLVPFFDVPGPDEGNYTISPETQRLLDKYAPQ